ncbi:MAG: alkyl hydroperoxide reductase AhpD [Alphaproteobacteria bacterium]|nr:MAG: alkyl hydroperoxide reductase AhpD [Alphaproteobacteria bacterium]
MPFLPSLPRGASLLNLFKMFPETSGPLIAFHEVLLRGPSPFSEAERELIAAFVSRLNNCRYCHGVHSATAELLGVPGDAIRGALDGIDASPVAANMKPVLRYAEKLTRMPDGLSQADADAVFAAGWDETALYHAVAVTALFNFMNRLVEGMGIELDPAYVKPASERLAKGGYLPLLDLMRR